LSNSILHRLVRAVLHAQHCLDSATLENDSKVAFFVPTKALVDQQFKLFVKYLKSGYRCQSLSGDEVPNTSLRTVVELSDVVVMTPQILLNALDSGELASLSVFTLLMFDECHHTKGHYPYNDIMARYYVDEKLNNSLSSLRLPQVLFCSSAVLDPRVGHTMDVLSPFISCFLFDSSTVSPVHVLMLFIQAVHGLFCLRAPGTVSCIIFSRQLPCFLMV